MNVIEFTEGEKIPEKMVEKIHKVILSNLKEFDSMKKSELENMIFSLNCYEKKEEIKIREKEENIVNKNKKQKLETYFNM